MVHKWGCPIAFALEKAIKGWLAALLPRISPTHTHFESCLICFLFILIWDSILSAYIMHEPSNSQTEHGSDLWVFPMTGYQSNWSLPLYLPSSGGTKGPAPLNQVLVRVRAANGALLGPNAELRRQISRRRLSNRLEWTFPPHSAAQCGALIWPKSLPSPICKQAHVLRGI